jgi:hypothetical protein
MYCFVQLLKGTFDYNGNNHKIFWNIVHFLPLMYLVTNFFYHLCHNFKMKKTLFPKGKAIPKMQA